MALIVEDGSGLANAESYNSVAEIIAYVTAFKSAAELATWNAAADQEISARVGAQYIDSTCRGRWKGYRANELQALAWPRSSVEDGDGYYLLSTALPAALKQAHAEASFRHASGDVLISDESAGANIKSESKSLGPLSKAVVYDGVKASSKAYPIIDRLLADLLEGTASGFGARRLERA